jgi:hypothetical protein
MFLPLANYRRLVVITNTKGVFNLVYRIFNSPNEHAHNLDCIFNNLLNVNKLLSGDEAPTLSVAKRPVSSQIPQGEMF